MITLYQWRNGLDDSLALKLEMEHEILPGSYFLSLEDAIAQHASNETWREAGEPLWESFRILSDHSNGGYSVADKASGGNVIERCLHEPWAVAFASISTLFQLSAECYKKDVYQVDDMFLEADWDLFESLEQKFKVG